MKVSLIIPNWNGAEKLKVHLPNILAVAKANKISEVIVSDDASKDNSLEILSQFPDITIIKQKKNLGFSSNINLAVERSSGDLAYLLNSDAEPLISFLLPLLPHFNNPKVFSVGSNVGGFWSTAKFEDGFFWHGQGQLKEGDKRAAHQTLWASGGSALFRKSIWQEMEGFDPLFNPFYEEDTDLGYRSTKSGFINIWEPRSQVNHYTEKGVIALNFAQKQIASIAQRNQLIFIWKNITDKKFLSEHRKKLAAMLISHPSYLRVFLSALLSIPTILQRRQKLQKQFKLTDQQVLDMFKS